MGRECVEGGVEDRGQVKLKHGAQEKQGPSSPPPHHTQPPQGSSIHQSLQNVMSHALSFIVEISIVLAN